MNKNGKWIVGIVLMFVAGIAGIAVFKSRSSRTATSEAASAPAADEKGGPGHITLKPEQVEHAGIKTETLEAGTQAAEIKLFGVIQEDPGASFVLRAQSPGIIEPGTTPWPQIGQTIADNTTVGILQPRLMPADQIATDAQRVSLATQVAAAQSDLVSATAALEAAKNSYQRLKELNAADKNVSDRVVEEALTKLKTEEAHVAGATQTLELAKSALQSAQGKLTAIPLVVLHGGEVVEVLARPGEAVESGQAIVHVARFERVLAAVDVPPDVQVPADAKEAHIVGLGSDTSPLKATRAGYASITDPKTKSQIVLFSVPLGEGSSTIRPGTPITAYIPAGGEPLKGVAIPRAAVVRYLGKAWVYVAAEANSYDRREVSLENPTPTGGGWFAIQGFKGGEQVVTVGAPLLLSQEINAAFGGGG